MMKQAIKLKTLGYILIFSGASSLISGVLFVFYFNFLNERLMMRVAKRQFYEKIELTTNLLIEAERLHRNYTVHNKDALFNDFIIKAVEEIDKQYGIYARVIDSDGRQLSRAFVAEGEQGLAILLDAEDYDFENDLGFIKEIPIGKRHIVSKNDVKIHLHWLRYPVEEKHYYYILLGIVYDRVIDTVDYASFSKGLFVVILSLLINFFSMVYLLSQNSKLRNKLQDYENDRRFEE